MTFSVPASHYVGSLFVGPVSVCARYLLVRVGDGRVRCSPYVVGVVLVASLGVVLPHLASPVGAPWVGVALTGWFP